SRWRAALPRLVRVVLEKRRNAKVGLAVVKRDSIAVIRDLVTIAHDSKDKAMHVNRLATASGTSVMPSTLGVRGVPLVWRNQGDVFGVDYRHHSIREGDMRSAVPIVSRREVTPAIRAFLRAENRAAPHLARRPVERGTTAV